MKQSDQAMNRIKVAVLYGGRSAEHEVSLRSATNVIQNLDPALFEVIPIGIDKQGQWLLGHDVFAKSLEYNKVSQLQHDATWFTPEWLGRSISVTKAKHELAASNQSAFDVIFPAVHGSLCEDGTLQGLLELADLPYVGCGVLSSALGMDKDVSKRLIALSGINVPPYVAIKYTDWSSNQETILTRITEHLPFPLFIKPANTGSSIGITKVKTAEDLIPAIRFAFEFDNKVLVEKALNVIELEIAVLESLENGQDPIVSVVGQIDPHHEFYSYDAKYLDENGASLYIPARVPDQVQTEAKIIAKKIFQVLECEGMARIDLFYDKDAKQITFNEINTIPGFTQISMYPKLMEATNISYSNLLTHLVKLAIKRHKRKAELNRNYNGTD